MTMDKTSNGLSAMRKAFLGPNANPRTEENHIASYDERFKNLNPWQEPRCEGRSFIRVCTSGIEIKVVSQAWM